MVVFLEALEGFSSVEANDADAWVFFEQDRKVVALLVFYIRIETAFPIASTDGIPEGDMVPEKHSEAFFIGGRRIGKMLQYVGHERPESIVWVGIVLLRGQGGNAWHGTKDDVCAIFIDIRRETDAMGNLFCHIKLHSAAVAGGTNRFTQKLIKCLLTERELLLDKRSYIAGALENAGGSR